MADKIISESKLKRAINALKSKFLSTNGGDVNDNLHFSAAKGIIGTALGADGLVEDANLIRGISSGIDLGDPRTDMLISAHSVPAWYDGSKSHPLLTSNGGAINNYLDIDTIYLRFLTSVGYKAPFSVLGGSTLAFGSADYQPTLRTLNKNQRPQWVYPETSGGSTSYKYRDLATLEDVPKMVRVSGLVTIDKTTGEGTVDIKLPITNTGYEIIKANFQGTLGQYAPIYFVSSSLTLVIDNAHVYQSSDYYVNVTVKKLTGTMTSTIYKTVEVILLEKK